MMPTDSSARFSGPSTLTTIIQPKLRIKTPITSGDATQA